MKLTFNGVVLDDVLDHYVTTNVLNRGAISPLLNIIDIEGRDGSIVTSKKLPPREIVVEFLIKANNNAERLSAINELTIALKSNNDVEFSFSDEIGVRYGQVSNIEDINYDYFQGVGKFTIYCQNPLREIKAETLSGTSLTIPKTQAYSLKWLEFEIETNDTSEVRISNNRGQVISLIDLPNTGKLVVGETITLNGMNVVHLLDYSVSAWKGFELLPGDIISVKGGNARLSYKELMP